MKTALISTSSYPGSLVVSEHSDRVQQIKAVVLSPEEAAKLASVAGDSNALSDSGGSAVQLREPDIVDGVATSMSLTPYEPAALNSLVKNAGIERYLIIGSAALVAPRRRTGLSYFA